MGRVPVAFMVIKAQYSKALLHHKVLIIFHETDTKPHFSFPFSNF